MQILKDVWLVNRDSVKQALPKLRYAPLLALAYLVYQIISLLLSVVRVRMNMGGGFLFGFIVYFVNIAMLAHFLTLLTSVITYGRLSIQDLTSNLFQRLISPLMQVFFIIYIIEFVFNLTLAPLLPALIGMLIFALWEAFKTPVPESVYLGGRFGMDALRSVVDYWQMNWAQWLPLVIIGIGLKYTVGLRISLFASTFSWQFFGAQFAIGLAYSAWMIWRGQLYLILDGSTVRSREYRRRSR